MVDLSFRRPTLMRGTQEIGDVVTIEVGKEMPNCGFLTS